MTWRSVGLALAIGVCTCGSSANGSTADDMLPSSNAELPAVGMDSNVVATPGAAIRFTEDKTNVTGVASMRRELLDAAATIDGHPITAVQALSLCETTFKTKFGIVTIRWRHVSNFAATIEGGTATIPIDDGIGVHHFALPEGDNFRRVEGTMGHLADTCEGK